MALPRLPHLTIPPVARERYGVSGVESPQSASGGSPWERLRVRSQSGQAQSEQMSEATRLAEKLCEEGVITLEELNEVVAKDMEARKRVARGSPRPGDGGEGFARRPSAGSPTAAALSPRSGECDEAPRLTALQSGIDEAFARASRVEAERAARFAAQWSARAIVWCRLGEYGEAAHASNAKLGALFSGHVDAARRFAGACAVRAAPTAAPGPSAAALRCCGDVVALEQAAVVRVSRVARNVAALAATMDEFVAMHRAKFSALHAAGATLIARATASDASAAATFDALAAAYELAAARDAKLRGAGRGEGLRNSDPLCVQWVAKELRWQWARRAAEIDGDASAAPLAGFVEATRALERERTAALSEARSAFGAALADYAFDPDAPPPPQAVEEGGEAPYRCEDDLAMFLNTGGSVAARNLVAGTVLHSERATGGAPEFVASCPDSLGALFTTHSVVKVGRVKRQGGVLLNWLPTTMVLSRFGLLQLFDFDGDDVLRTLRAAAGEIDGGAESSARDAPSSGGSGGAAAAAGSIDAISAALSPARTVALGSRWGAQLLSATRFAVCRAPPTGSLVQVLASPAQKMFFDAESDSEAAAWVHAIERTSRGGVAQQ